MDSNRINRLGALSGVLFVVLSFAGVAAGRTMVTVSDSDAKIVKAFADPAGSGIWVGAYLELLALAAFAFFVAWLYRGHRGPLITAGLITAAAYVAVTLISLVVGDVLQYRAGHGVGAQEILALFDLQSGLFFVSWGLAAGVLALAPVTGWLRRSALVIAPLLLVAMAVPKAGPAQFPNLLFLIWVIAASVSLARHPRTEAGASAVFARA
jgi:uncharacterized membrane protein